jgi:hypothetical protein
MTGFQRQVKPSWLFSIGALHAAAKGRGRIFVRVRIDPA